MNVTYYSLGDGVILESNVAGETAEFAGDPLHALLALHNGHVDVVDALDDVGHGAHYILPLNID